MFCRIASALFLAAVSVTAAFAQAKTYPITGMDGTPVMNHVVPPETGETIRRLPHVVSVGSPKADVTIYEFYDLNCSFCRRASADLKAMLAADPKLGLVLVPFPVLGIPSIQAGRVDFALAKLASPEKFYQFHQKILSGRGTVDGERALTVAQGLGFTREKVLEVANGDAITEAMKTHVRLGDQMDAQATPTLIVADVAIVGYPGRAAMEKIVRAVRACGRAHC